MKINKVLCPVDFSDNSKLALDYSLAIAREHGATITVMHVLPNAWADPNFHPYLSEPVFPSEENREKAYHQLGALVHEAREANLASEVLLEEGNVLDMILQKSESLPADLVVMGTHGRRGLSRLLMGSVTERVLRHATTPVVSVSPHASKPPKDGATFKKILCGVDFSPSSMAAISMATKLMGSDSELVLMHVVEFYVDPTIDAAVAIDLEDVRERHREEAEKRLRQAVPDEIRDRTSFEVVALHAHGAYREILRVSERDNVDLIVLGVIGRSGTDMFFFGSTANHVVRSSTCPVLTIRASE